MTILSTKIIVWELEFNNNVQSIRPNNAPFSWAHSAREIYSDIMLKLNAATIQIELTDCEQEEFSTRWSKKTSKKPNPNSPPISQTNPPLLAKPPPHPPNHRYSTLPTTRQFLSMQGWPWTSHLFHNLTRHNTTSLVNPISPDWIRSKGPQPRL